MVALLLLTLVPVLVFALISPMDRGGVAGPAPGAGGGAAGGDVSPPIRQPEGPPDPDLPGPPIVDPGNYEETLRRALRTADLETEFRRSHDGERLAEGEPLIENVTYEFAATATLSSLPLDEDSRQVEVAIENDAALRSAQCDPQCAFDIAPDTPIRQRLTNRRPLKWEWDVTPRLPGHQTLILEIEPILVIEGSGRTDLRRVNRPIRINVEVHPNRAVLNKVLDAAENINFNVPDELTAKRQHRVTALLPLPKGHQAVRTTMRLEPTQSSISTSITREQHNVIDDRLIGEWTVTPEAEGPLTLVLTISSEATAGDRVVVDEETAERSLRASQVWWEQIRDLAVILTAIIGLPIAVSTLWNEVRKHRRRASALSPDANNESSPTPREDEAIRGRKPTPDDR